MALNFSIQDWKVWSPGAENAQPDVSVIPPLLRRRLSPLARAAISVVMPLAQKHGAMPLVYVSRHGDLSRTVGLLENIAKGEPLSPTAFSLSVHNATAGLFSIYQGLTKSVTAISCGFDDVIPALLESLGQCNTTETKVLCVFCDEPPPAIYVEQANQPGRPFALAMVISRGSDWQLEINNSLGVESDKSPQALQLLALLDGKVGNLCIPNNGTMWQLSRYSR